VIPGNAPRKVPGKLILALQRCLVDTFNEARWTEMGYATDTTEIIDTTHRLRRSLAWNDDDYPERVFTVIERIVNEAGPTAFDDVVEFAGLRGWLATNDPKLHAELFGAADTIQDDIEELETHETITDVPELLRHGRRIRAGLESDPELAIGSAKELLETVMKGVLDDPTSKDDIPGLVKRTRTALALDGAGSEQLKRMMSNLSQLVVGVAEVRNIAGTGHGRAGSDEPSPTMARLAVDSAIAVSRFILEIHAEQHGSTSPGAAPEPF
jgi:AbiJ N-terminal domain 5/Abortive infection C-terminus